MSRTRRILLGWILILSVFGAELSFATHHVLADMHPGSAESAEARGGISGSTDPQETSGHLYREASGIVREKPCTAELLGAGVQLIYGTLSVGSRSPGENSTEQLYMTGVCAGGAVWTEKTPGYLEWDMGAGLLQRIRLIRYVHDQDGKKRGEHDFTV